MVQRYGMTCFTRVRPRVPCSPPGALRLLYRALASVCSSGTTTLALGPCRELASIGGDFRDLVAMGFNVGLMFRWRPKFGPHILSEGPFDVTFAVLNKKMGCTLDELVFGHHATSCDLALLKLDWGQALRHGFAFEHVVQLAESHAGIESSLGAPAGAIVAELKPANGPADGVGLPPPLAQQTERLDRPTLGCKSFKL